MEQGPCFLGHVLNGVEEGCASFPAIDPVWDAFAAFGEVSLLVGGGSLLSSEEEGFL